MICERNDPSAMIPLGVHRDKADGEAVQPDRSQHVPCRHRARAAGQLEPESIGLAGECPRGDRLAYVSPVGLFP